MNTEILAPAGSYESLVAAVRCGASAVYLGGKSLNARQSAANFDDDELSEAVKYCHASNVKVYLTLNTLLFDSEIPQLIEIIKKACEIGIDALIVQDLAAAAIARECAGTLPIHASTQMAIHNVAGAKALEKLGFSRVVLARELSRDEIAEIKNNTTIELECFVHGALCMCISGQCYFSAMLGGRSGNRGLCAQPCRLPFSSPLGENSLSLKDLSVIPQIDEMIGAGVCSLKIEGRMKRPEYVAAAVTAVKKQLAGEAADMDALRSVFSRDGFTDGYFSAKLGRDMFGTRRREDVVSASHALLSELAASYKDETASVSVSLSLTIKSEQPSKLIAKDSSGNVITVFGDAPQIAKTAPTTHEKAMVSLSKTGGTIFFVADLETDIDDGMMLPASALNFLRREALAELLKIRSDTKPHIFTEKADILNSVELHEPKKPTSLRVRLGAAEQFSAELAVAAELLIIPANLFEQIDESIIKQYAKKIAIEAPRILFGEKQNERLKQIFGDAKALGITHAVVGNLGSIELLRDFCFDLHGDFSLNITNSLSLEQYVKLGLSDVTTSFELTRAQILKLGGKASRGILAYGHLPLMVTRNCPVGSCEGCKNPTITDRLKNKFPIICGFGVSQVLNCVPMYLAERQNEFSCVDFLTLYFTIETNERCKEILQLYQAGSAISTPMTRGLYYRGVE